MRSNAHNLDDRRRLGRLMRSARRRLALEAARRRAAWVMLAGGAAVAALTAARLLARGLPTAGAGGFLTRPGWTAALGLGVCVAAVGLAVALATLAVGVSSRRAAAQVDRRCGLAGRAVTAEELLRTGDNGPMAQLVLSQAVGAMAAAGPAPVRASRRVLWAMVAVWLAWAVLAPMTAGRAMSPTAGYDALARLDQRGRQELADRIRAALASGRWAVAPQQADRAAVAVELDRPGQLQAVLDELDRRGQRELVAMLESAGAGPTGAGQAGGSSAGTGGPPAGTGRPGQTMPDAGRTTADDTGAAGRTVARADDAGRNSDVPARQPAGPRPLISRPSTTIVAAPLRSADRGTLAGDHGTRSSDNGALTRDQGTRGGAPAATTAPADRAATAAPAGTDLSDLPPRYRQAIRRYFAPRP